MTFPDFAHRRLRAVAGLSIYAMEIDLLGSQAEKSKSSVFVHTTICHWCLRWSRTNEGDFSSRAWGIGLKQASAATFLHELQPIVSAAALPVRKASTGALRAELTADIHERGSKSHALPDNPSMNRMHMALHL